MESKTLQKIVLWVIFIVLCLIFSMQESWGALWWIPPVVIAFWWHDGPGAKKKEE